MNDSDEMVVRTGIDWLFRHVTPTQWTKDSTQDAFLNLVRRGEPLAAADAKHLRWFLKHWNERLLELPAAFMLAGEWAEFERLANRHLAARGVAAPCRLLVDGLTWKAYLQVNDFRVNWPAAKGSGIAFHHREDRSRRWMSVPVAELPQTEDAFASHPEEALEMWFRKAVAVD